MGNSTANDDSSRRPLGLSSCFFLFASCFEVEVEFLSSSPPSSSLAARKQMSLSLFHLLFFSSQEGSLPFQTSGSSSGRCPRGPTAWACRAVMALSEKERGEDFEWKLATFFECFRVEEETCRRVAAGTRALHSLSLMTSHKETHLC